MEKRILKKPQEERITGENSHGLQNSIQSNPSIERWQKLTKPEGKQGKNIWKEVI